MDQMKQLGFQEEIAGLGFMYEGLSGQAREVVLQPRQLTEAGRCHNDLRQVQQLMIQ